MGGRTFNLGAGDAFRARQHHSGLPRLVKDPNPDDRYLLQSLARSSLDTFGAEGDKTLPFRPAVGMHFLKRHRVFT